MDSKHKKIELHLKKALEALSHGPRSRSGSPIKERKSSKMPEELKEKLKKMKKTKSYSV